MFVLCWVIYYGFYFVVLGLLIGVLFFVFYIFFVKESLVFWVIIYLIFFLLLIIMGVIFVLLIGVMVVCLLEKIGLQKCYCCLVGGIGGVVIIEIYCVVIVYIKGMVFLELFENIFFGDSFVVRIIFVLLVGVVMSRIIIRLFGLDILCFEIDFLS